MRADFYDDVRHCPRCERYVRYLSAPGHSFCIDCGGAVRLFSPEDQQGFQRSLGGRAFLEDRRPYIDDDGGESGGSTRARRSA